jgi:hypothetical protein
MNSLPVENLELRALEQRNRLHKTAGELKTKIAAAREKLDMTKNVRGHFLGAAVAVSFICFLSGYGFGGIFSHR